jgi:hypothetical protein
MPQYVAQMNDYKGKTLRQAGISCEKWGPVNPINVMTCWFREHDPGAFSLYDPDGTVISEDYLHRASTIIYKINSKHVKFNIPTRKW